MQQRLSDVKSKDYVKYIYRVIRQILPCKGKKVAALRLYN